MASHGEEVEAADQELSLFSAITIYDDSEGEHFYSHLCEPKPPNPPPLPLDYEDEALDFERYVQEECRDKVKILNPHSFHEIAKPMVIGFNHFREKCHYYVEHIKTFHRLAEIYEDRIVFLLADLMDLDVFYKRQNPVTHFCTSEDLRLRWLSIFIIDERKRIQQHFEYQPNVENMSELCEQLLSGELYASQPIPNPMEDSLVRLGVHLNFQHLVMESPRHVLLAVSWGDYQKDMPHEPDYEQIARVLQEDNVDVVYMNAYENFMPFDMQLHGYPLFAFIDKDNKENPVYFTGFERSTENLIDFVQKNLRGEAQFWLNKMQESIFKPFCLPQSEEEQEKITFENLQEYLNENFPKTLQVLDRRTFKMSKRGALIYFMDFKHKGIAAHLDSLRKLHQMADARIIYDFDFLLADIEDMDVIYPAWYAKYLPSQLQRLPRVFARDRHSRWYEAQDFPTVTSMFIYCFDLIYERFFRSQPWAVSAAKDSIKSCGGQNLQFWLKKCERDVFLTVYWSSYKESHHIMKVLEDIAQELNGMKVQFMKIDAKHNYIPIEYKYTKYPVHFFIPRHDKLNGTMRFVSNQAERGEDIKEFLRSQVGKEVTM